MKKLVLFLFLGLGLSTASCSSDDASPAIDYSTEVKGIWEESTITFLDEHKKVIKEIAAFNIDNCALTRIEIKEDIFIEYYSRKYDPQANCQEGTVKHRLTFDKNLLITEFHGDDYIDRVEYKVNHVDESKMVLERESTWYDGAPEKTRFMKIAYSKKRKI
ncbi:hypothetical protein ACPDHL_02940 [Myroides sp. C15-4]|uniref:hypothetical protein n=1 Tax=Myroides sp. C15-4 TaxID=3400532 RepID=UPI003D2F6F05